MKTIKKIINNPFIILICVVDAVYDLLARILNYLFGVHLNVKLFQMTDFHYWFDVVVRLVLAYFIWWLYKRYKRQSLINNAIIFVMNYRQDETDKKIEDVIMNRTSALRNKFKDGQYVTEQVALINFLCNKCGCVHEQAVDIKYFIYNNNIIN